MTQLHTFISVCMDSAFLLPDMTETFFSRKDRGEWGWRGVCVVSRIRRYVGRVLSVIEELSYILFGSNDAYAVE